MDDQTTAPALPEGEYAIAEVLGHRTIVGRISEVERFGTKLMAIEPLYEGKLLPPVLVGGSSIYQLTPCAPAIAAREQPKHHWQLPPSIRVTVPEPDAPALPWLSSEDEEEEA